MNNFNHWPMPVKADYDTPEEYQDALNRWERAEWEWANRDRF